jgi:hypothetical protein
MTLTAGALVLGPGAPAGPGGPGGPAGPAGPGGPVSPFAGGSLCPHAVRSKALNMTNDGRRMNQLQMAHYLMKPSRHVHGQSGSKDCQDTYQTRIESSDRSLTLCQMCAHTANRVEPDADQRCNGNHPKDAVDED